MDCGRGFSCCHGDHQHAQTMGLFVGVPIHPRQYGAQPANHLAAGTGISHALLYEWVASSHPSLYGVSRDGLQLF